MKLKKIILTILSMFLILLTTIIFIKVSAEQPLTNGNNFGNDGAIGVAWTSPSNAKTSDNSYASAVLGTDQISQQLNATNFGFNIPSGATINGINVTIERQAPATTITDATVNIIKSTGDYGVQEKGKAGGWGSTDFYQTYGNATDLWGETWTPSDINSANFGVSISATNSGPSKTASIDHIRMQVFYTNATTNTCTYTSGNWNINLFDNCSISTNNALGNNNLIFSGGYGNAILKNGANITNVNQVIFNKNATGYLSIEKGGNLQIGR